MGVGMLRRYHTQVPEHVNEPGDVEASKEAQRVDEVPDRTDDRLANPDEPEGVEPPARSASAEEWRTYAVEHHGADPTVVADMTRNQLRDEYGPKAD